MAKGEKMADLIDRDKLFHGQVIMVGTEDGRKAVSEVMSAIWNAPAVDAVEVVRCKNCIHSTPAIIDGQRKCELLLMTFFDDDFCSMGERREDG